MRILLLDLGRELRGGQIQVEYLARALVAERGFQPVVASPAAAPLLARAAALGAETIALPGAGGWDPRSLLALRRAHRARPFLLLHTHDARAAALGAACRWSWARAARLVHTRRVSYPLRAGLSRAKYRAADRVVAVSAEIARVLAAGGVEEGRVRVIHSGIDPSLYRPRTARNDGRFVFAMVGALTAQKGYEVLLEALFHLAEIGRRIELPDWAVTIVGDGPLRGALERQARRFGLAARLSWLGAVNSRDVLCSCDALLVPSVAGEGSSGAIKEGWATGLPLACSDLPSNLELVRHGESGLALPTGDARALASAMARLMGDPALRDALAAGGRLAVEEFTDRKMAAAYIALYRELADAGPA